MARIIALLLVLLLLFSGCRSGSDGNDADFFADVFRQNREDPQESASSSAPVRETPQTIRIGYGASDSLHPFRAQGTLNLQVAQLVYDPLVRLDEQYRPEYVIASDVTMSQSAGDEWNAAEYLCTVRVRRGLFFTDGSEITAEDIVYSLGLALSGESAYARQLAGIAEFYETDEYTVEIRLLAADKNFPNLLTFPVIKRGTDEQPVGSGRYRLNSDESGESLWLERNFTGGNTGRISRIELVPIQDYEMLAYALRTGEVSYMFDDMSGGEAANISSSSVSVQLNNMVYVGINGSRAAMSDRRFRQALSLMLDRNALVEACYGAHAGAAWVPMNPAYYEDQGAEPDPEEANFLLDEMWYTERDEDGIRLDWQGNRLALNLLVGRERPERIRLAERIAVQAAQIGIEIVIEELTFSDMESRLAQWDYDLYIGEIRQGENMDCTALLEPLGALAHATATESALLDGLYGWRLGTVSDSEWARMFADSAPFLPICYRKGLVSYARDLSFSVRATERDIFYNIADWS